MNDHPTQPAPDPDHPVGGGRSSLSAERRGGGLFRSVPEGYWRAVVVGEQTYTSGSMSLSGAHKREFNRIDDAFKEAFIQAPGEAPMTERRYLPTVGDLIDRLSISMMKSVKIDRERYRSEMRLIRDDLYTLLGSDRGEWVGAIYPMLVLTYINAVIWENEAAIRAGTDHDLVTHQRLRLTHSLNGVRNRAKNEINKIFGGRVDDKIDCLAADLSKEFGNWRLFDGDDDG